MRDMTPSSKFPFCIKVSWNTDIGRTFLRDLAKYFPCEDGGLCVLDPNNDHISYNLSAFVTVPFSGPARYADLEVVVENREKQGYVYFWFRSQADSETLVDLLQAKRDADVASKKSKIKRPLMRMSPHGSWYDAGEYPCRTPETFVGYGAYLDRIVKDIERLNKHRKLIEDMGESVSLNYLLFGPPGTGKTTLALTVATVMRLTVHIASSTTRNHALLSPPGKDLRVLLFEDFDRCLNTADAHADGAYMSDVLNTLDGVNSGSGVIRFFTGNDCEKIFANKALSSRMTATFRFDWPSRDMFQKKLDNVYAAAGLQPPGKLGFDLPADMTMRQFSAFAIRHVLAMDSDDEKKNVPDPTLEDILACQTVAIDR